MASQPLVSLNKALLNPYFWGGTLGGVGWLAMNLCLTKKAPKPQGAATRVTPSPRFRISPVVSGAVAFGAPEPSTLAASPHKTRHPSEGVTCAENDLPFEASTLEY